MFNLDSQILKGLRAEKERTGVSLRRIVENALKNYLRKGICGEIEEINRTRCVQEEKKKRREKREED